jgi:hypothetical protein
MEAKGVRRKEGRKEGGKEGRKRLQHLEPE